MTTLTPTTSTPTMSIPTTGTPAAMDTHSLAVERQSAWVDAEQRWLAKQSGHTARSYATALRQWHNYLARNERLPWHVDDSTVIDWVGEMVQQGKKNTTVNQRMAAISSLYSYIINAKRVIDGVEIDLFVDRLGRARQNPFLHSNVQRLEIAPYERARPLTQQEFLDLMRVLQQRSTSGKAADRRNLALISTYITTGWRSQEVLDMRWERLRPHKSGSGYTYPWKGKRGKRGLKYLPERLVNTISGYLDTAGRLLDGQIQPNGYIWLPVMPQAINRLAGWINVDSKQIAQTPINGATARGIVRRAAKAAGIEDWRTLRVHDLRHTYASIMIEQGVDLLELMERMNHANPNTTIIYAKSAVGGAKVDQHAVAVADLLLNSLEGDSDHSTEEQDQCL